MRDARRDDRGAPARRRPGADRGAPAPRPEPNPPMKLLLSLLVVANVLLFGWFRGWMAPLGGDGRDPARIARQVEPQQIRVLPSAGPSGAANAPGGAPRPNGAAAPPPAAVPAPPAGAGSPGMPAPASAAPPTAPAVESPPPDPASIVAALRGAACVEIGPMSESEAVRVQVALDAVAADLAVTTRRADDITSYWVYLPPSSVDLAQRLAELRARGVTDTYVMPDGNWRGAISLGLFRQEELAVALQRSIGERGVKGVRVAPRGPSPGRITLQVRPVPDAVAAELARLRASMPDAVARPCPARG
jgi:hypothetical protein